MFAGGFAENKLAEIVKRSELSKRFRYELQKLHECPRIKSGKAFRLICIIYDYSFFSQSKNLYRTHAIYRNRSSKSISSSPGPGGFCGSGGRFD
jgi:hypothetical protein